MLSFCILSSEKSVLFERRCVHREDDASGSKSVHDIGAPLQLPGELFPQHIVTAAALEKSFVVFHGKIQGAVPVQASTEASLSGSGKSQQLPAFLLRQAGFQGGVIVRRQLELLFKAIHRLEKLSELLK